MVCLHQEHAQQTLVCDCKSMNWCVRH